MDYIPIENAIIRPGEIVIYKPQYGTFIARPEDTGFTTHQRFLTEQLCWKYFGKTNSGNILIVCDSPCFLQLSLFGYVGFDNGPSLMHTICSKLYSNPIISAVSENISRDTWHMMPRYLRNNLIEYWVANQEVYKPEKSRSKYSYHCLCIAGDYDSIFHTRMYRNNEKCGISTHPLRPIVVLSRDLHVAKSEFNGYWHIQELAHYL